MRKLLPILWFISAVLFPLPAHSQGQNFPGGGSGTGISAQQTVAALPATSNLIGQYEMVDGSVTQITDSSGKAAHCATATGITPTFVTGGGYLFSGNGNFLCPAALNAARTIIIAFNYQPSQQAQSTVQSPFAGNGNGGTTGSVAIQVRPFTTTTAQTGYSSGGARWESFTTAQNAVTESYPAGIGDIAWVMGASNDSLYENAVNSLYDSVGTASAGLQTTGVFAIGGNAAGSGEGLQSYFNGTLYKVFVWNTALTAQQVQQVHNYINFELNNQGITPSLFPNDTVDSVASIGDSLSAGGSNPAFISNIHLYGTWQLGLAGTAGIKMAQQLTNINITTNPLYRPNAQRNVAFLWACTNDFTTLTATQCEGDHRAFCLQAKIVGWKCIVGTMISRTTADAFKDALNPLTRQNFSTYADGLCDFAANANIGADGANTNGTYFNGDMVHFTPLAGNTIVTPMAARCISRMYAPHDFSTASVYSGGGASPQYFVQQTGMFSFQNGSGATTETVQFNAGLGNSTAPGDMLIACGTWTGAVTQTVTDSESNSYTPLTAVTNGTVNSQCSYAFNIIGGNDTITFTYSGAGGTQITDQASEFRGLNTLDQAVSATGTSTTPSPGTITTTKTSELVIGYAGDVSASQTNWTAAAGFTPVATSGTFGTASPIQYKTLAAATGYVPSWTIGPSVAWQAGAASFYMGGATVSLQDQDIDHVNLSCASGGLVTVNLQTSVGETGQPSWFRNQGTGPCTLVPNGSETINSLAQYILPAGQTLCLMPILVSNTAAGENWQTCETPTTVQTAVMAGSAYTNATTGFTSLVGSSGPTLQFPVNANTSYSMACELVWQASAATAGPKFQVTGPGSPTSVQIGVMQAVTATSDGTAAAVAFSSSINASGATVVTATNETAHITMGLNNGANAGTVVLQSAAQGVGTLTVQPGSYCTMTQIQ